ncbi:serine hydrolase [Citricoccus sp. NPDC079358]|uniref:serine hydrolase n=1 Tax=Citricoccus sp. NPDC079358 TaxID=3154653 RepID=UPI00344D12FE
MRTSFILPVLLAPLLLTGCSPAAEAGSAASGAAPSPATGHAESAATAASADSTAPSTDGALADLEERFSGRVGVYAVDTGTGDETTSVDREEPGLNEWAPGETRDTTTPRQAAENLRGYALDDTLEPWARDELLAAMRASENSEGLIRAAVPEAASWTVANKSGAGLGHGTRNDLAVIESAEGAPLVVAVYTNLADPEGQFQDDFVAEAATVAVEELT